MEEPKTYSLKKGTVLYRGDTPFYLANKDTLAESLHLEVKPTFLALEPDDVYQYGIIYGWEVPEDIELPLIDNHDVMTGIYKDAPPDVQQVMRENYGYRPDGFAVRVSYFEKDIIFYQYLCEQGYPGYASYDLEDGETIMGISMKKFMVILVVIMAAFCVIQYFSYKNEMHELMSAMCLMLKNNEAVNQTAAQATPMGTSMATPMATPTVTTAP